MLAGGYAEVNPDKAFPLLESTILRANDTISAFVKVAEFIDVNEEIIADGEVQAIRRRSGGSGKATYCSAAASEGEDRAVDQPRISLARLRISRRARSSALGRTLHTKTSARAISRRRAACPSGF